MTALPDEIQVSAAPPSVHRALLAELDENQVRIPFGPRATQTMPASWAAEMLTEWREANQAQFGRVLAKVAARD